MDGQKNGKPYESMDDLGGVFPPFTETTHIVPSLGLGLSTSSYRCRWLLLPQEQQIGGWTQVSAHGTGARIPPVDVAWPP